VHFDYDEMENTLISSKKIDLRDNNTCLRIHYSWCDSEAYSFSL